MGHPPQRPDGLGMQELEFVSRRDLEHAASRDRSLQRRRRLGSDARHLGNELDRGDPDRAPQTLLGVDRLSQLVADLGPGTEETLRPGDVQERLVERQRFDQRRERGEDLHDPSTHLAVASVITVQEHGLRAQAPSAS